RPSRVMPVVTHYHRLPDDVIPDFAHVLVDGRTVKRGDADLARNLETHGYGWIVEEAPKPQPARAGGPVTSWRWRSTQSKRTSRISRPQRQTSQVRHGFVESAGPRSNGSRPSVSPRSDTRN